jgi:hypothetical protein
MHASAMRNATLDEEQLAQQALTPLKWGICRWLGAGDALAFISRCGRCAQTNPLRFQKVDEV